MRSARPEAAVTIDSTYVTPSQNSAAMEPHASIAVWEDGALTLYGAYQMPTSDAQQLAKSLGVSQSKVKTGFAQEKAPSSFVTQPIHDGALSDPVNPRRACARSHGPCRTTRH